MIQHLVENPNNGENNTTTVENWTVQCYLTKTILGKHLFHLQIVFCLCWFLGENMDLPDTTDVYVNARMPENTVRW